MTNTRTLRRRFAGWAAALTTTALALSGCSVSDIPLPGGANVGDHPITVHAMFRDVLDLVPQSTVKIDDVTVGRVTAIKLKGYVADVTMQLPANTDLPDNARAELRQTSLLGEKFVSLSAPDTNPSSGRLSNGDVIGLSSTGRNPEVEEVLGALAALLNGGGVGQLKIIASEMNKATSGREADVRSVLDQLHLFMGQLARNKDTVVSAIENLNRLAIQLRKQDSSIKLALDDLPAALASVNKQRSDLKKMLAALSRLSGVGVRVIQASKQSTINSLRDLAPVLNRLAAAGQNWPRSLQVFLTYPFVDDAVGRDPQVARNLHMGDYTNLSVRLDLDSSSINLPNPPPPVTAACKKLKTAYNQNVDKVVNGAVDPLPGLTKDQKQAIKTRLRGALHNAVPFNCDNPPSVQQLQKAADKYLGPAIKAVSGAAKALCKAAPSNPLCDALLGGGAGTPSLPPLPTGPSLPSLPGVGRAELGAAYQKAKQQDPFHLAAYGYDAGIGTLLFQGVAG